MDKSAESSVELHPIIAARWSPRALDPSGEVGERSLRALLEAARWAPSDGNTQPARYLVGRRGDDTYARIFDLLNRGNKTWAGAAAVLLLACAVTVNEKGTIPHAEYGVGLASENLVLQAVAEGLVAHQMGGFNTEGARLVFALPDDVRPLAVIAIGRPGSPDALPDPLKAKELAPRRRLPLNQIAFTGEWGRPAF
ncbi:MAG TPA: nitroreductase family protein [Actinophytocola sp.]|uniref:nitroreductase family protein n=1 Tax=Actinophytocola sp. TaxID=1872138 RepID=UPI002DDD3619|nr:nitroreductase family protein [Actinophytocola sp.]HEV2782510.1 nitroreductase family protein [Actinophytocola sp.]